MNLKPVSGVSNIKIGDLVYVLNNDNTTFFAAKVEGIHKFEYISILISVSYLGPNFNRDIIKVPIWRLFKDEYNSKKFMDNN